MIIKANTGQVQFVSDGKIAYFRYVSEAGETWIFGGYLSKATPYELRNAIVAEADNLDTAFNLDDAVMLCRAVLDCWPYNREAQEMNDRDLEMNALACLPTDKPLDLTRLIHLVFGLVSLCIQKLNIEK